MVTISGQKFFLTADIGKLAQDNVADVVSRANGLNIPHHGINLVESVDFTNAISASIGVLTPFSWKSYPQIFGQISPITQKCKDHGIVLTNMTGPVSLAITSGNIIPISSGGVVTGMSLGYEIPAGGDADTLPFGLATIYTADKRDSINNVPSEFGYTSYFLTIPTNANTGVVEGNNPDSIVVDRKTQFAFGQDNIGLDNRNKGFRIYFRRFYNQAWGDWFDLFNPSNIKGDIVYPGVSDFNEAKESGFFTTRLNAVNGPSMLNGAAYLFVFSYVNYNNKRNCLQVCVPTMGTYVNDQNIAYSYFVREYHENPEASDPSEEWTSWRRSAIFDPETTKNKLPNPPDGPGTYVLKCTVGQGGIQTYAWVKES